jgi:hypothetical protein
MSWFPAAFRRSGVSFLGHPVPVGGCASFTVGLPRRPRKTYGPVTGLPRSACARCVRVGRPLGPEAVVLTRPVLTLRPSPAASQQLALNPSRSFHLRGST